MLRFRDPFPLLVALCIIAILSGCSGRSSNNSSNSSPAIDGEVHGGQQPVSGVSIQMYAVGTTGDGSSATPLLAAPVFTNANGNFTVSTYTCPSPTIPVYIVGTGGDPIPGTPNPQLALMSIMDVCGNLSSSTYISINERTTVAAAYALAPYMTGPTAIGFGTSDAGAFSTAFTLAAAIANPATGATPGANVPTGVTIPTTQVNTIADIVAACINSAGGVANDGITVCGTFLGMTTPGGTTPSTDTITALVNLANNPTLNTSSLYPLAVPASPYQPFDSTQPPDLSIPIGYSGALLVSPATGLTFPATVNTSASETITVTNPNSSAIAFSGVSFSAPDGADFAQTNNCPASIAAYASCSVFVSFSPKAQGTRTSAALIQTSAAGSPAIVPLSGIDPQLVPSSASLAFVPEKLYANPSGSALTETLFNTNSTTPVTIYSITFTGPNAADFGTSTSCITTIAPASSCNPAPTFSPTGTGSRSGTMVITSNAANPILTIPLSGVGIADTSILQPSASSLSFSNQVDTQSTQTLPVVFTNLGPDNVGITSVTITGTNPGDFTFGLGIPGGDAFSCSNPIVPSAECGISVTFSPTATGPRSAILTVNSSAVNSSIVIPLNGSGVASGTSLTLSAYSLTVPGVALGDTGTATQINVTNSAAGSVAFSGVTFSGTNPGDFTSTNNCPATLAPNAFCTVSAFFKPQALGQRSANLNVNSNAANSPGVVALIGYGDTDLQFTFYGSFTTPVDLPETFNVRLSNASLHTVTLNGFSVTGPNASLFSQTNNCGSTLVASSSTSLSYCTVAVTFLPLSTGTFTASLVVASNDPSSPLSLPLTGTATPSTVVLTTTATSLSFVNTGVGQYSSLPFSLGTAGGQAYISAISITGPNASEFTPSLNCVGAQVPTCSSGVSLVPVTAGPKSATLVITSTASNSPLSIPLTGTAVAVAPTITFSPTSLTFPSTSVGTPAALQFFTVTNNGPGPLTFTSAITLTGANVPDFSEADNCPSTLAANALCTVNIVFTPQGVGSRTSSVIITSNAGTPSATVPLSGTGLAVAGPLVAGTAYMAATQQSIPPFDAAIGSVYVTNTGTATVTLGAFSTSSGFIQTNNCGATLAPLANCTFTITPSGYPLNPMFGTLTIDSNATNPVFTVELVSALYPIVDFGSAQNGTVGSTQSFSGGIPPSGASVFLGGITGTNASDFLPNNPSCTAPYQGIPCTATVTFNPTGTGQRSAILSAQINYGATENFTLIGTGTP